MAIDSRMPRDVQEAFNTLLQAELNHEKQMRQARAQQEQEKQLMKLESEKLSNQMFQTTLRGQLETKSLQLKSAQQQSASTLEMHKFLSEQEDKRQMAREREASRQTIATLAHKQSSREQTEKHKAWMARLERGGEIKSGQITQEYGQKKELEEVKLAGKMELAKLNNSDALKRLNTKHDLDVKFTKGQNDFKAKQSKLHRDMKTGIAAGNRASKEEIAKKGRALQRHIQKKGHTWKSFENALDRKVKESIANLRSEGKDKTRENSVKSLRDLEDMYKTMAAVSAGADVGNLGDAKHNDESRAYMAMMAAVGTAATEVANAGGDWKLVLKKYLETNEVRLAIETSSEAHARFRTMELMLQGVSAPELEVQGEEIPTGGGSIPTGPGAQGQSSREAAEAAARQRAIERRRNERGVK